MLRRIVGYRCLVNPLTGRHLYPWRRLGAVMHANHESVRQWHGRGIDKIVSALRAQRCGHAVRAKVAA